MTERTDCGVVGLAIARAFAVAGREGVIVKADNSIGNGISSRNSEVIQPASITVPVSSRQSCASKDAPCCIAIAKNAMSPSYAGVRPKLAGTAKEEDFLVSGSDRHGYAGLINLFGIESPGLTSSLAMAQYVLAQSEQP